MPHWTQTPQGRRKMSEIQKKVYAEGRSGVQKYRKRRGPYKKNRKAVTESIKKVMKHKNPSPLKVRTLTVYYNDTNGGIDMTVHKVRSYAEIIDILYEQYAGIHIIEARYV